MANTSFSGKDGQVKIKKDAGAVSALPNLKEWAMSVEVDVIDATIMGNGDWKGYIVGMKDWSGSAEMNFSSAGMNVAFAQIGQEFYTGTNKFGIELWLGDAIGDGAFYGPCVINGATPGITLSDPAAFPITFQGNGEVQFTTSTITWL